VAYNYYEPEYRDTLPIVSNFCSFLAIDSPRCEFLTRWVALENVMNMNKMSLENIKSDKLYKEFYSVFTNGMARFQLKSLELSGEEKRLLERKQNEYLHSLQIVGLLKVILKASIERGSKSGVFDIFLSLESVFREIQIFSEDAYWIELIDFSRHILTVLLLSACGDILLYIHKNKASKKGKVLLEKIQGWLDQDKIIKPINSIQDRIRKFLENQSVLLNEIERAELQTKSSQKSPDNSEIIFDTKQMVEPQMMSKKEQSLFLEEEFEGFDGLKDLYKIWNDVLGVNFSFWIHLSF